MLRNAAGWILDLLYPPTCAHCRRVGAAWCETCQRMLDSMPGKNLTRWLTPDLRAVAAHAYDGVMRDAVVAFKFQRATELADSLAGHIAVAIEKAGLGRSAIVPVPSHTARVRWRGYDHTALLAEALADHTGLPYVHALERSVWHGPQVGRDAAERHRAVQGAFVCSADPVPAAAILVDDVVTTGATMIACADTLRAAGAASVVCAAVCFA
ncbi:MAG: ComF family protein [Chloroflexi bacterium]|nr:ComF family protein [Chloroflexota bacterium]